MKVRFRPRLGFTIELDCTMVIVSAAKPVIKGVNCDRTVAEAFKTAGIIEDYFELREGFDFQLPTSDCTVLKD